MRKVPQEANRSDRPILRYGNALRRPRAAKVAARLRKIRDLIIFCENQAQMRNRSRHPHPFASAAPVVGPPHGRYTDVF
jgi:hypothetical protein